MKKTLFLIIALAGALSLRAEENELFEDFDFSALEQDIVEDKPKASSEEERAAEERELKALFSEINQEEAEA